MNIEKLRQIWDDHARAVYAFLLKLTRSEPDARDFLQDIFHRLAKQPDLIANLNGAARPYLLRFARNVVVDQARRNQVRDRILGSIEAQRRHEYAPAEDPDAALLRGSLARGLAQLPEGQREVVHARLWQGHTFDEIARESGLSINTVASRYRYGVDKMREQLRELYEDLTPQASPQTKFKMKDNTDRPLRNLNSEEPLIQPLEQRRVPSATGAAFALPILPLADDHDAQHDVRPAAEDGAIDNAEFGDELILIDDEDLAFINLPMNFDEMAEGIEWGTGEDGVPFDPRVLWQSVAPGAENPAAGGAGVVTLNTLGNSSGVLSGNSVELDAGSPIFDNEIEVLDENDPRIFESAAGGDTGDHTGNPDHEGPAKYAADGPATPATPVSAETSAPEISGSAPEVSSARTSAPEIVHLDHLELHVAGSTSAVFSAAQDSTNDGSRSAELQHGADESASADQDLQFASAPTPTGAAAGTVDQWVPVEDQADDAVTDLITEPLLGQVETGNAPDTDHAEVTADAGALSAGSSTNLRHGLMAAALAGTVAMNRDPKSRREKEGN